MNPLIDSITRILLAFAGVAVVLAFLLGGERPGIGAAWGAGLAVSNWLVLRWVSRKVVGANVRSRPALLALLAGKMLLLVTICWALITRVQVHPLGFVVGLGVFLPALFIGATFAARAPSTILEEET
ncbi:MAG: hypothetical protein OEY14_16615 [Myxococcales bacterium]|nr:hypothetical protein [Myxococcales bacterium]